MASALLVASRRSFVTWIVAALIGGVLQTLPASAQTLTADDLFDGSVLHDIWIHINAKDLDELRANFLENTYYTCDLEWRGTVLYSAGVRSRGAGSQSGVKPGFKLEFDKYVAGQAFLGMKSLVLDNAQQDPSFLKERLTMQLFQRMGLPAPRESHARVYVGSSRQYAGVYAIVEDIDTPFLRRQFGEDAGYLFEYAWQGDYHFEDLGPDVSPYAVRFDPKTHVTESAVSLFSPIQELVRAINDATVFDVEAALTDYLDVRKFLTHVALENFLSEWDGILGNWGLNNFYLYRFAGTKLSQLIAWDKDNTFTWLEMPPWHNVDANVLMQKVWALPELRTVYLQKLVESADSAGGWLEEEIVREADQIRAAVFEDPRKPYSNDEFDSAIEDLKRFARERAGIVRRYVSQIEPTLVAAAP